MNIREKTSCLFPNVWRIVAPNPSPMTPWGTNTYLVGNKRVVVIDPGPALPEHIETVCASLKMLKAITVGIVPTHPHSDHDGCAHELAQRLDAPLLQWANPLGHNEVVTAGDTLLQVKYMPGHINSHICLWLPAEHLLFAGDLVAGSGTVVVIPPDGDMADYLASLRAAQNLKPAAILPGHGPVIEQPVEFLQSYLDHRLKREQQILQWANRGVTHAPTIAAKIYKDRPDVLRVATLQVEAHLQKLKQEGRL